MRGKRTFALVRGSRSILTLSEELSLLASRCGQENVMVHLPYLMSTCRLGAKVPHLLLQRDGAGSLTSAVLVNQYMVRGIPTGIFIPADASGQQSVIATEETRSAVVKQAAAFLLRRRAIVALLSLRNGDFSAGEGDRPGRYYWTAQTRTVIQTLPLQATLDTTLATLGSHTRRNLRHFQRRAVKELGAVFEPEVRLSEAEFLTMNRHTLYPVPEDVAACRLETVNELAGSFMIGLRARDGAWLSLVGGRRYDGTTTIDWQMNTDALPSFSLGTAMRMFLLEDETARGTRCLSFDGGTSHPMHRAFVPETVSDLLLIRSWLPLGLLRRALPPRLPVGVLLSKMLLSKTLMWRRDGL